MKTLIGAMALFGLLTAGCGPSKAEVQQAMFLANEAKVKAEDAVKLDSDLRERTKLGCSMWVTLDMVVDYRYQCLNMLKTANDAYDRLKSFCDIHVDACQAAGIKNLQ